jgi:hypothetical protein
VIKDLVMGGLDADFAIDRIYQAYGYNKSITYIINQMYKDKSNASGKDAIGESWKHPNMRESVLEYPDFDFYSVYGKCPAPLLHSCCYYCFCQLT